MGYFFRLTFQQQNIEYVIVLKKKKRRVRSVKNKRKKENFVICKISDKISKEQSIWRDWQVALRN